MAGRRKEPLAVIIGKGKSKHLTKDEIKKRQAHEANMQGETDNIEPPNRLNIKQKARFTEFADQLIRLEIFSNLDVDTLAQYIEAHDQYVDLQKALKDIDLNYDFEAYSKRLNASIRIATLCRRLAGELGLTISSRLKLTFPENLEIEKTEVEQKFGDI